jgi:hypothetical protein
LYTTQRLDGSGRYGTATNGHLFSRVIVARALHILAIMKQPAARDLTEETEMTSQGADLDEPIPYRVAQFHGDARPVLDMLATIRIARRHLEACLNAPKYRALNHARAALRILNNIATE